MKRGKIISVAALVLVLSSVQAEARSRIYWADSSSGKIQQAYVDGSDVQDVVTGLSSPFGVAVDAGGRKVYWTDSSSYKIQCRVMY